MNTVLLKLLNMSAAGSVLILAVVLLRALLRRAPRWIICAMWALVAIRLVCPISLASPLSVFGAMPSVVSESGEIEFFMPARGSGSGETDHSLSAGGGESGERDHSLSAGGSESGERENSLSAGGSGSGEKNHSLSAGGVESGEMDNSLSAGGVESGEAEFFLPGEGSEGGEAGSVLPAETGDTPQTEEGTAAAGGLQQGSGMASVDTDPSSAAAQSSLGTGPSPLVPVYLAGLAAMLLYAVISLLALRRKVAVSLRQRGNVRICDELASPFILGIFCPVIYLPSSLSREERRFVLAHERAHLRRLDHIWKPLGFVILSLHWFNPFCWLAYGLLCRDIELACDEKVVRDLGRSERVAYSQTLLNVSAHRILSACPVAFGESGVKARIKAVLNYRKPALWLVIAALAGALVLLVCFAADPMPREQDLSFLNYKNAITLIAQSETPLTAVWYPEDTSSIRPGNADKRKLAQFLESARWNRRRAPSQSLSSPGSIEYIVQEDYRITVWQSPRIAAVRFDDQIRYYRTAGGDYEAALAVLITEPPSDSAGAADQGIAGSAGSADQGTAGSAGLPDQSSAGSADQGTAGSAGLPDQSSAGSADQGTAGSAQSSDPTAVGSAQSSDQGSAESSQSSGQISSGSDQSLAAGTDSSDVAEAPLTVLSSGATVEPWRCLAYELKWTEEGWTMIDGSSLAEAVTTAEDIPTLTLADDFEVRFLTYVRKSGLQIYDEDFNLIRDSWYGDTAVNWLEPGTYYGVIEAFGPMGRYIESQGSYEENVYNCVFRLNVPEGGIEPYVPDKAAGLTEATLHVLDEDYSLTDADGLARLEAWLTNAEPMPYAAGCPFGSLLTVTCADGSTFSCCPAEDSCGIIFSDGNYYRFASDNEEFYELFDYKFPWNE